MIVEKVLDTIIKYPIIIVIIIIDIILALSYKKVVGWFGERWTKNALKKLPKNDYKIINDLLISLNKKTYQIDHVIVSKYGIFCIETKQYNGYITGSKYDKKWIRHSGKNQVFYTNPIRQNYGHCLALSELLKIDLSVVYNLVCISSNAKLNIKHDGELVSNNTIVKKILSYQKKVINNPDQLYNVLINYNIKDYKVRKKHIDDIKKNIRQINDNECPLCGGRLVKRKGPKNEFIGCSNYPNCKYTKSLK